MVIETTIKSTNNKALIDDLSICSVEEHNNGTSLWLYGKDTPTIISMPFDEAKQVFIEAKKRDKFTGELTRKSEQKKFKVVEVGEHKFQLDIRTSEYEDGMISSLQLYANFHIKNDLIKQFVEYVAGVENYCDYSFNKYEGYITIGKLFDAETVREQVEQKIKECLSNE